jgi:hypothetical protein
MQKNKCSCQCGDRTTNGRRFASGHSFENVVRDSKQMTRRPRKKFKPVFIAQTAIGVANV